MAPYESMDVTAQAFEVLVRIRIVISHMRGSEKVRDDMKG
jgi:hypothetical protein